MAICHPLQYATITTNRMVLNLSLVAWGAVLIMVSILLGLTIRMSRCRRVIPNLFCDNASLFSLSCDSVPINHVYGLGYTVVLLSSSLGSKTKTLSSKALQTCTTHLTVYVLLLVSAFIIVGLHRFPQLSDQRKVAAIVVEVALPALNSVIYVCRHKRTDRELLVFQRKKRQRTEHGCTRFCLSV